MTGLLRKPSPSQQPKELPSGLQAHTGRDGHYGHHEAMESLQ